MNIYKIRQRLDEIERLRATQPSALESAEDIAEAIEYQTKRIQAELKQSSKLSLSQSLALSMQNADSEIKQARTLAVNL